MSIEITPGACGPVSRLKITRRLVDALRPGQTIWDKELTGSACAYKGAMPRSY
jgi:hypothetical protein